MSARTPVGEEADFAHILETSGEAPKKYQASCHCSSIRYTVLLSPPLDSPASTVTECSCSICTRHGKLNVYVPNENVEFEEGCQELMKTYTFGKRRIAHYFCPDCGCSLMCESLQPGFFEGMKAVNVRMFHDVDLKGIQRREIDGKSL